MARAAEKQAEQDYKVAHEQSNEQKLEIAAAKKK
jgi:hypothetical protein